MLFPSSSNPNSLPTRRVLPFWVQLLLAIVYFLVLMFVGQFVGVVLIAAFFSVSYEDIPDIVSQLNHTHSREIIYLFQGCSSFFGFVLGPLLYIYHWGAPLYYKGSSASSYGQLATLLNYRRAGLIPLLLAAVITLAFMVVNSPLIEWNASWQLPAGWATFEQWARGMEESAARLTRFMVEFSSFSDFLLALLVMGVIAAVGEELLFRGLLQPILGRMAKNAHLGIWLSAFLFSLFHFQLFGLLPRMALGVVFGYLFYWSGSLVLPILGHFINNGFTLLLAYLARLGYLEYDWENTEALPVWAILVCLVVGLGAAGALRKFFTQKVAYDYVEQGV